MRNIEFDVRIKPDSNIIDAFNEGIYLAMKVKGSVDLNTGDFIITIYPDSYIEDIKEKYELLKEKYQRESSDKHEGFAKEIVTHENKRGNY